MGLWHAAQTIVLPGGQIARYYALIAILSATGIIVTAAYILRVVHRVFFGEFEEAKWHGEIGDVTALDKISLAILVTWLILLGVYPRIMEGMITAGMEPIVRLLGGA